MFFVKNLSLLLTVFVCFSCAKHGVVDESGKVISEEEIAREKKSKNTVIYTLGGGVLSFGVGVFASSFVYRGDKKFKLVNPISIGTGVVGTSILFFQG